MWNPRIRCCFEPWAGDQETTLFCVKSTGALRWQHPKKCQGRATWTFWVWFPSFLADLVGELPSSSCSCQSSSASASTFQSSSCCIRIFILIIINIITFNFGSKATKAWDVSSWMAESPSNMESCEKLMACESSPNKERKLRLSVSHVPKAYCVVVSKH